METIIFRFNVKFWGCIIVFQIQKKVDFPAIATLFLHPRNLTWIPTNCRVSNKLPFPRPIILGIQPLVLGTVGHVEIILILLPAPCPPRQPSSRHHRCLEVIVTILSSNFHIDPHMDVSENNGTPKSSILIGFSIINHPFWGTPIFGNTLIFTSSHLVSS